MKKLKLKNTCIQILNTEEVTSNYYAVNQIV